MNESQEAYDLLPEEVVKNFPPLYGTENEQDAIAHLKWFTPDSSWTW